MGWPPGGKRVALAVLAPLFARKRGKAVNQRLGSQVALTAGLHAAVQLFSQAYAFSTGRSDVQRRLLRWMFSVQEIGHALIELRLEQARLPALDCYAESMPWRAT